MNYFCFNLAKLILIGLKKNYKIFEISIEKFGLHQDRFCCAFEKSLSNFIYKLYSVKVEIFFFMLLSSLQKLPPGENNTHMPL